MKFFETCNCVLLFFCHFHGTMKIIKKKSIEIHNKLFDFFLSVRLQLRVQEIKFKVIIPRYNVRNLMMMCYEYKH